MIDAEVENERDESLGVGWERSSFKSYRSIPRVAWNVQFSVTLEQSLFTCCLHENSGTSSAQSYKIHLHCIPFCRRQSGCLIWKYYTRHSFVCFQNLTRAVSYICRSGSNLLTCPYTILLSISLLLGSHSCLLVPVTILSVPFFLLWIILDNSLLKMSFIVYLNTLEVKF
jgi:hypothetical protein